jgi:hypothetical protein
MISSSRTKDQGDEYRGHDAGTQKWFVSDQSLNGSMQGDNAEITIVSLLLYNIWQEPWTGQGDIVLGLSMNTHSCSGQERP